MRANASTSLPSIPLATVLAIATLASASMVAITAVPARASCGADGCVLDLRGPESGFGRFSLDLSYQFIDQDDVRIGRREAFVGEIPSHHNEIETRSESWTATLRGKASERLFFTASLPYIDRLHRHEHEHHPGFYEEIEWNYSGLGDLLTMGFYSPWGSGLQNPAVTFQAGFKAPTGKRNVDLVDGEQPEPMARPGTGSWDGLAGVQVRRFFDTRTLQGAVVPMPFSVGVLGRVNGRGTDDYRIGNELQAHASGAWGLLSNVSLLGQVNARWRAKDDAGDLEEEDTDHTGGTSVYASPGLRFAVGHALSAYGYYQMRVYERVNGIQITAPSHFMVGTSYRF